MEMEIRSYWITCAELMLCWLGLVHSSISLGSIHSTVSTLCAISSFRMKHAHSTRGSILFCRLIRCISEVLTELHRPKPEDVQPARNSGHFLSFYQCHWHTFSSGVFVCSLLYFHVSCYIQLLFESLFSRFVLVLMLKIEESLGHSTDSISLFSLCWHLCCFDGVIGANDVCLSTKEY